VGPQGAVEPLKKNVNYGKKCVYINVFVIIRNGSLVIVIQLSASFVIAAI
jgi:hypothetical protein